jgi:isochorismate hydrolase
MTVESVSSIVAAMVGGAAVLSALVILVVQGFWETRVKPAILQVIQSWYQSEKQIEARKQERDAWFAQRLDSHAYQEAQREAVRKALRDVQIKAEIDAIVQSHIDNEIKRSDGLITKGILSHIEPTLSELRTLVTDVNNYMREDAIYKQRLAERLGRMEGVLRYTHSVNVEDAESSLPAVAPPVIPSVFSKERKG